MSVGLPGAVDRMSLVTWNLAGLDDRLVDERTEAACFEVLLRPEPVVVLALQELVRRSWHGHWKHHLKHAGYTVFPADPTTTESEYFSAIAVLRDRGPGPGGVDAFPGSRMGRALVFAEVGGWLVCTGHLESERGGSDERIRQLASIVARLERWPGPAVFAGDTNLRVQEEPRVAGLDRVTDAWSALGRPADGKATWIGGRIGARFDRIYTNRAVRPVSLSTFGAAKLPEVGARISDHLGLLAHLERTETERTAPEGSA